MIHHNRRPRRSPRRRVPQHSRPGTAPRSRRLRRRGPAGRAAPPGVGPLRTRSVLVSPAALEGLRDVLDARAGLPVYVMSVERLTALVGFNMHRGCLAIGVRPPATPVDAWWAARRRVAARRGRRARRQRGQPRRAVPQRAGVRRRRDPAQPGLLRSPLPQVDTGVDGRRAPAAIRGRRSVAREPPPDAGGGRARAGHDAASASTRSRRGPRGSSSPGATVALLVGHEGDGLSDAAMRAADERVRIAARARRRLAECRDGRGDRAPRVPAPPRAGARRRR